MVSKPADEPISGHTHHQRLLLLAVGELGTEELPTAVDRRA
jgi:hypothetical protein